MLNVQRTGLQPVQPALPDGQQPSCLVKLLSYLDTVHLLSESQPVVCVRQCLHCCRRPEGPRQTYEAVSTALTRTKALCLRERPGSGLLAVAASACGVAAAEDPADCAVFVVAPDNPSTF